MFAAAVPKSINTRARPTPPPQPCADATSRHEGLVSRHAASSRLTVMLLNLRAATHFPWPTALETLLAEIAGDDAELRAREEAFAAAQGQQ